MQVLYFLQSIRTPILDAIMSFITTFGEETIVIVMAVLIFWCYSKKDGYYLIVVGFLGMIINQLLKIIFRIPRPWIIDKNFEIVESAREQATGYSFPSGHTQNAVGLFGATARFSKALWIRIACIALLLGVAFSRMYLGVHTPLDVGVSLLIGGALVFGIYPIFNKFYDNDKVMGSIFLSIVILSVGTCVFILTYNFPSDVDMNNINSGLYNSAKLIGSSIGLLVSFFIEKRYIKFETKAPILAQVIKVVLGFLGIVIIKSLLKTPINFLFGEVFGGGVRYFLIITFAVIVWPLTFKYITKFIEKLTKRN